MPTDCLIFPPGRFSPHPEKWKDQDRPLDVFPSDLEEPLTSLCREVFTDTCMTALGFYLLEGP